jgi:hypothetical protein
MTKEDGTRIFTDKHGFLKINWSLANFKLDTDSHGWTRIFINFLKESVFIREIRVLFPNNLTFSKNARVQYYRNYRDRALGEGPRLDVV